ncbi:MAG: MmcQ/YjbR family DNA-binding protein [Xanthomonadales bacterium]|nr:MmcQ/YjbR family DNA-binding protein [Xanthomonadales bacterium]
MKTDPETLKSLALALPEAETKPHFDRLSFRVGNKIFATLAEADGEAVVKLTLADQSALVGSDPETFFLPGWSHQGWTGIRLDRIAPSTLQDLLRQAWRNVAPKSLVEKP